MSKDEKHLGLTKASVARQGDPPEPERRPPSKVPNHKGLYVVYEWRWAMERKPSFHVVSLSAKAKILREKWRENYTFRGGEGLRYEDAKALERELTKKP